MAIMNRLPALVMHGATVNLYLGLTYHPASEQIIYQNAQHA